MKLFVGLGNPGPKYAGNRHNIGFMAVDAIADGHGFGPWRSKFQGRLAEGTIGSEKVLLLKPETFMNLSGQSVGEAVRFYKLDSIDVTVFHDELDLPPGKLKLKLGGGHAGHNGLRSVHQHIGPHYARVRLGIGHPGHKDKVSPYVLSDFAKADQAWLDDMMRGISDGAPHLLTDDNAKFTNAVALRMSPNSGKPAVKGAQKAPQKTSEKPVEQPPEPPTPPSAGAPEDSRSKLQKLVDKFK